MGKILVAIDGPAGAGKSAAARELAVRLGVPYLDTGAMYRAVGLLAQRAGITPPFSAADERRVVDLASGHAIAFAGEAHAQRVLVDGIDVTSDIRAPETSRMASVVSAIPGVRREMVRRQRDLAALSGGVIEGRDIGTVVFPDAAVKVFLTASAEVRARRRLEELRTQGVDVSWESVLEDQRERDRRDSTRVDSPLRPADDAMVIDTSSLTLERVVEELLLAVRRAAASP